MDIRKSKDIIPQPFETCHDGEGTLLCKSLLGGFESESFLYMHSDDMPAGVSIGLHTHNHFEELYYLVKGKGMLTYDNTEYEMKTGDISLCKIGHSHAFRAIDDCVLIVVAAKEKGEGAK